MAPAKSSYRTRTVLRARTHEFEVHRLSALSIELSWQVINTCITVMNDST